MQSSAADTPGLLRTSYSRAVAGLYLPGTLQLLPSGTRTEPPRRDVSRGGEDIDGNGLALSLSIVRYGLASGSEARKCK